MESPNPIEHPSFPPTLLTFEKWRVFEDLSVCHDGELILDREGEPLRQIVGRGKVIFAVHLRDAAIALHRESQTVDTRTMAQSAPSPL